jgi:acetyl-CoA synthetase
VTGRFSNIPDEYTRIAVGAAPGWHRFEDAYNAAETFLPDGETRATDPLLMYFTSGITAEPKLVMHNHQYPIGQLSTMYFAGFRPGDIQLGMASPGWAAYLYWLFAGWTAGTTIVALA